MKTTKKEMRLHSFFDYDGIAAHFEKMAAEGWMLDKVTRSRYIYKRAEPAKIKFAVTYYAKASEFDPKITEGQLDFNEFCAQAGWQFVDGISQMQVYFNQNENPTPLETDPVVQVNNVHKAMKANFLLSGWVIVALCLGIIGMQVARVFASPTYTLTDNSIVFMVVIYTILLALIGRDLATYYIWKAKATKAATEGYAIPSGKSNIPFQKITFVITLIVGTICVATMLAEVKIGFLIAAYLTIGGVYAVTFFTQSGLKKLNAPKNLNRLITFTLPFVYVFVAIGLLTSYIIKNDVPFRANTHQPVETYEYLGYQWEMYKDDIPLKVEHFQNTDYTDYSYEMESQKGMFATKHTAKQEKRRTYKGDVPEIRYEIYRTNHNWAYNLIFNDLYKDMHRTYEGSDEYAIYLTEENADDWKAVKAYRQQEVGHDTGTYLLCYEDKIVELRYYDSLTPQQKTLIGQRFAFRLIGF